MKGQKIFVEKICPICKRRFYPGPLWVYKTRDTIEKTVYYCRWNCYNEGLRRKRRKR